MALQGGELRATGARAARKLGIPKQRSGEAGYLAPVSQALAAERARVRRHPRAFEASIVAAADLLAMLPVLLLLPTAAALPACVAAVVTWKVRGLYARRISLSVLDDLPSLTLGAVAGLAAAATVPLFGAEVSTRATVGTAALLLLGTTLTRAVAYAVMVRERSARRVGYPTVMIGAGQSALALSQRIEEHPESGLHLVGTLASRTPGAPGLARASGTSQDLGAILRQGEVTDVVIGYGGMSSAELVDVLRTCNRADIEIHVVPRLFELHTLRCRDDHIWGLPLVRVRRPAQRELTWRMKRACDVTLAGIALLLCSPLLAAVALAVRAELGGGVIFRQTRVGLEGRHFDLMKFRSVQSSPDGAPGPWTLTPDMIGPVGRFIRRYSLDELPQLLNVLRGDMSLVGPRPERPEYVEEFCAAFPRYVHRHRVPVGMTGLAAVNGLRGDTSIEDRAHFDNWYIDNWSLWLDIKIMARTVTAVLKGGGG